MKDDRDPSPFQSSLDELSPLGRCGLLPAIHAAQTSFGHVSVPTGEAIARALGVPLSDVHGVIEFYSLFYNRPVGERILRVCSDPACALAGGERLLEEACRRLDISEGGTSPDGAWTVERAPCLGLCGRAPAANLAFRMEPKTNGSLSFPAPTIQPLRLADDGFANLFRHPEAASLETELDPIGGEPRLLTALCGGSRAATLAEYETHGGMDALRTWIGGRRQPQALIAEIKASGLVGMGGAAFPTGLKWQGAADAVGEQKYFVVNADESEPGTFKDRVLLEGDPCRVLEGAVLGAYAVGAHKAYAFVRGEYTLAIERLLAAREEMLAAGCLGEDILGSGYSLDLEIRASAGAYICGEETALFAAIEGERGLPRVKPPFPTTHGLFGKPTAVNNVETLVRVPYILSHGAAVYRQTGTADSPGTKLFCLSGDVVRPGVYEVPFGTTLRHLLFDLAGGVAADAGGGELGAVLFGGASGAFAGPERLDVPLSFEDLRRAGLPLGSGVVMVFNQDRDLRRVLVQLARFFAHESCGKCYPCQLGTQRQLEALERFASGSPQDGDLDRLLDIGWTMTDASLCGLGQTAASAVLSLVDLKPDLFERAAR